MALGELRRRLGGCLIAAGILAAGCAGSAAAATGWSRTDIDPVSQPAPVSGKFVLYVHRRDALQVIALNAGDGSTSWVVPAAPSGVTAGVPATLAVRDGVVFYFVSTPSLISGAARIVARNVASGRVLWRSPTGWFSSWPEICPDQDTSICVGGAVAGGFGEQLFSATDGKPTGSVRMTTNPRDSSRELGAGLFDPGTRSPEQMLAVSGGHIAWRHPLPQIFSQPGASSDGGWDVSRYDRLGLFVGSVGVEPTRTSTGEVVPLSHTTTVGFRLANGDVAWRAPGLYACGSLPCPGANEAGYNSADSESDASATGVRLVQTGTVTYPASGTGKLSPDAAVTVQGFATATGKTLWSFNAGHEVFALNDGALPQVGASTIVLHTGSGYQELDLSNGTTRHLQANARAWCQGVVTYSLNHAAYYQGRTGQYVGQDTLYPCTVDGHGAPAPRPIPAFVSAIGATAGGMTAWMEAHGVYAAPS